ncbi:zymogen granule membrane protein 16-like [Gouania willdenowi]|uniref:Zymogen granule membrane protein 16-like n=1 Tax=Gouania willdenowi TaxID=441366 RepID=A0A8C5DME1_GOUWI|nr:zymogen granule membrane protein 16-like [Gouania willdenowi]XP_028327087.1 zymogen granule membrane protein 16-like [Gouania willdenowi]
MISYVILAVLCAGSLAVPVPQNLGFYSFSVPVGGGSGQSFATQGEGRITAVRMWENSNAYITGFQLRYENIWCAIVGKKVGSTQEMELHDGETIVQLSGKYHTNYIYQLIFVTSTGRMLMAGQPTQRSFNMYPKHPKAELIMLSGRFNGFGITELGAHWQRVNIDPRETK